MLQLPECRAQTHKLGKGSRERGSGRQEEEGGWWKRLERSTRGFILPWGEGRVRGRASPFQTFQKQNKTTQTPSQTKRAIMQA
jgi:hypothetical protein